MPSTTIYSSTDDCHISQESTQSWAQAMGNGNSTGTRQSTHTSYDWSVYGIYSGSRGTNTFRNRRAFFDFDLSSLSIGTVTAATLSIYSKNFGDTGDYDDVVVVATRDWDEDDTDYGKIFTSGASTTLVNTYSSGDSFDSSSYAYESIALNSTAISDINNKVGSGTFYLAVINKEFDYKGAAPQLNGDYTQIGMTFADDSDSSIRPKLELTYTEAGADSILFGTNF
tara:strand:+ start:313 stop:990 length:678 start_codon:yes stop_codon:yes gene_type:complete